VSPGRGRSGIHQGSRAVVSETPIEIECPSVFQIIPYLIMPAAAEGSSRHSERRHRDQPARIRIGKRPGRTERRYEFIEESGGIRQGPRKTLYCFEESPYPLILMLLIAAALQEELKVALAQCLDPKKIRYRGIELWRATRDGKTIGFVKTGVGPRRSALSLELALGVIDASRILVVGYAGALDPNLKIGTLVSVKKALLCSIDATNPAVENIKLDRTFMLEQDDILHRTAESGHLQILSGDTLTTSHVWGNPVHKSILLGKFGASIVDMETAALADVAERSRIPLHCLRVVSDEAKDSFLEPFSYDPTAGIPRRAGQIIRKGNPVKIFREWKCNTSLARVSLNRFLAEYL